MLRLKTFQSAKVCLWDTVMSYAVLKDQISCQIVFSINQKFNLLVLDLTVFYIFISVCVV